MLGETLHNSNRNLSDEKLLQIKDVCPTNSIKGLMKNIKNPKSKQNENKCIKHNHLTHTT